MALTRIAAGIAIPAAPRRAPPIVAAAIGMPSRPVATVRTAGAGIRTPSTVATAAAAVRPVAGIGPAAATVGVTAPAAVATTATAPAPAAAAAVATTPLTVATAASLGVGNAGIGETEWQMKIGQEWHDQHGQDRSNQPPHDLPHDLFLLSRCR
ncbi:MAG: hypothetical protein HY803_16080 [candidate division NC10 bacterium]|nr:hypothetical protein [candidate division NC10 bacterium]